MNYNETTGESINRSVYQDIREKFKQYAKNWNGIWTAYLNKSPSWGGRWVPGNKGRKIQMRDTIPVSVRYLKYLDNNGTANHEQQNIVEESNRIHTIGNENNIRRSIHSLNNKMVNYFDYDEYALVENYDKTFLKSYKVKLVEYDTNLDVIQSEEFWTDSYQTFKKDDVIKLYKDADLKEFVMEAPVVYRTNNPYKKVCVEWTEDRYYVTHTVSIVDGTTTQPELIGENTNVDVASKGVKKYSQLTENPNDVYEGQTLLSNPEATAYVEYDDIEDTILSNQKCIYTFDNNSNWKLDNEDVIRKTDYQQLQQILKKIEKTLKLRDNWFKDDRCDISCQVACQNRCQVACQACNTKQCHDQKCGTH